MKSEIHEIQKSKLKSLSKKPLLLLLLFAGIANAQIISFPDANFKQRLVATTCVDLNDDQSPDADADTNNDGEIEVQEALAVQSLIMYSNTPVENIDNLTGIAFFPNLKTLVVSGHSLTTFNISMLSALTYLNIGSCGFTNFDMTGLENLETLYCYYNNFTTLNLTPLQNLKIIDAGECHQLTDIDLHGLTKLEFVGVHGVPLESLDLSSNRTGCQLQLGGPLKYLYIKNGQSEGFDLMNSYDIRYICADEADIPYIRDLFAQQLGIDWLNINPYCTFQPGSVYNTIEGKARFDANGNGCDVNDQSPTHTRLKITKDGNVYYTYISLNQGYKFYAETPGNYTVTPEIENPSFFNVSPPSTTVSFSTMDYTESIQDFCVTTNGAHPDLEITVAPIGRPRPGFDCAYSLVYKNKGNQVLSGAVTVTFDDARVDFVSATTPVTTQSPNTLSWSFSDLQLFETRSLIFVMNVNSPMEIPAVNNGDILSMQGSITISEGEETPADNVSSFQETVVNSYDPNDKTCLEGANVSPEMIGKYLHYNINFENTGTADAINIVVIDDIDTTKFDLSSLQVQNASHPVQTRITGNKVEFFFENINLPPSVNHTMIGHGNVMFKIKTKPTLVENSSVMNKANIYFDYNWPIVTNEATTVFTLLTQSDFVKDNSVSVYPNPAKDKVSIKADSNIKSVQLYDLQGRLLHTSIEKKKEMTLDISARQTGVYFLKITTEKGTSTQKVAKE
jgi:uncharacterized repeat protein (TIGR01451 family)